MTGIERVATLVMLIPGSLWAGIILFYAVERVNLWMRMPIDQFVIDFRRSLYRADPLQPITAVVTIVGAVVFALSAKAPGSILAWIGAALVALVIVVSILFPERINSMFRRRQEGEAPPNVDALRTRWRTLHLIRTVPAMAALVCLVLATTYV